MSDRDLAVEESPATKFYKAAHRCASGSLIQILGDEAGKKKAAQFSVAFTAAATSAQNPNAVYGCSPASVASCMVNSILTGIMPSGPAPGVYLIPKGGNLCWWLNHRGYIELARRAGQIVQVRPLFQGDVFDRYEDEAGIKMSYKPDQDRDESEETYEKLLAMIVVVRFADGKLLDVVRMSKREIERRRAKSMQAQSGPWKDWAMEMAYKTAVKYAAYRGMITFQQDPGVQHALTVADPEVEEVAAEQPQAAPAVPADPALGMASVERALLDCIPAARPEPKAEVYVQIEGEPEEVRP